MSFQPKHIGLYFDEASIQRAQSERSSEPYPAAWAWLAQDTPADLLTGVVWGAYRWRFMEDAAAAQAALASLPALITRMPTENEDYLSRIIGIAQAIELLRSYPTHVFAPLLPIFRRIVASSLAPILADRYLRELRQVTLRIVAGVVLEDEALFHEGVQAFKQVIDEEIHPEGYIRRVVAGKNKDTFQHQTQAVAALTLAAEAATHAGVPLWQYESRGISVSTAATYLQYYYFYPEKWRWDETGTLTTDQTKSCFQEWGAFMEIVALRTQPRDVHLLLDDQRPMFSACAGGLTTLTHALPAAPKKRGWFR